MLGTIVDLIVIACAAYGIYVFWLWHKIAKRTTDVWDETDDMVRKMEQENSYFSEPDQDEVVELADLVAKMSPASRALYEEIMAELRGGAYNG